jgi:hypothetical protein
LNERFSTESLDALLATRPFHGVEVKLRGEFRTLAMDAVQAAKSGHPGTPKSSFPFPFC